VYKDENCEASKSRVVDRLLEQGFSSTDIACAVIHELWKDDGGAWKAREQDTSKVTPPPIEEQKAAKHESSSKKQRPEPLRVRGEGHSQSSRSKRQNYPCKSFRFSSLRR
jgi:hypothetical protein